MQGMPDGDFDFSFKNLFVQLTNKKAIVWLIIVSFIVYANMLFNGFVWDDLSFIINNPQTHIFDFSTIFLVKAHLTIQMQGTIVLFLHSILRSLMPYFMKQHFFTMRCNYYSI
jgi:hypothetical protein